MKTHVLYRREVLQLGGAALGIGLAAACAPIGSPPAAGPTVTSAGAPTQPKSGGTLTYGQLASILNTLPYPASPSNATFRWAMFNTLLSLDERKQPAPNLAESWSLSDDRLTLTLKLRQGVKFHSGRPFTAEEAKWNIEFVQDPKTAAQAGGELRGVQARALDSRTLELKLPDVLPHIFSLLSDVYVLDPQSDITLNAAGTGPFKLDSLTPGSEMRLIRNAQYWKAGRPYLDGLTFKVLPDPGSALVTLESSAIGAVEIRRSDVQQLRTEPGISVVILPASGSYDILLNTANPPFNDKRVRQAMNLAVDRKRFSETLLYGVSQPAYIIWPRTSPAWDASLDVGEFNLDKARQLLAEAGYANGFETKIQASNAYPEQVQFDQVYQADLAKIGVTASVEQLEASEATTLLAQASFPGMLTIVYSYADVDPGMAFAQFSFRTRGNGSRFQSDEYIQLVDSARREPDSDKRLTLYRKVASFIKDEAFVLPLADRTTPYGMRSNVHGLVRQPVVSVPAFEDVWLE